MPLCDQNLDFKHIGFLKKIEKTLIQISPSCLYSIRLFTSKTQNCAHPYLMKSFPPFKDKQAYTIITGSYYMIKNGIKNRLQEKYSTTCTTVVRNLESTYIM